MTSRRTRVAADLSAVLTRFGRYGLLLPAFSLVVPAALNVTPAQAHSDFAVDVRGGFNADKEEGLLGAGVLTGVGASWDFNPNVEWTMVPNGSYFTVNGDFHHDFYSSSSGPAFWLGAGPALAVWRRDVGKDDTHFGVNLFGGVGATQGSFRPYGQAKFMIADASEFSLAVGARF